MPWVPQLLCTRSPSRAVLGALQILEAQHQRGVHSVRYPIIVLGSVDKQEMDTVLLNEFGESS